MKVRIQTAANQTEVEVVIFAPVDSHEAQSIKTLLEKVPSETKSLTFYQGTTKYYLKPSQILFFLKLMGVKSMLIQLMMCMLQNTACMNWRSNCQTHLSGFLNQLLSMLTMFYQSHALFRTA